MTRGPGCTIEQFTAILEEVQNQPAWRARADREADYYDGNQLDSELLQSQRAKGIPPSIENLIGRTVDDILGMEAKNRSDWKVISDSELGGDDVADALNQKLNKAERESGADRACTDAHSSQVRVGLGWVEVCREKNPFKFPYRCRFVHRNEIWWDMKSCEPDLSDAMWLLRRRWVNTDIAALMFPKKKDIIKRAGSGWHSVDLATLSTEGGEDTGLAASLEIERGWSVEEQEWRDQETNRVCLFELLTRHYKQALVLKLPDGRIVEFNQGDPLHQKAVMVGMPIISATISDVWKTFFLGPHKLHQEKSEYKHGRFNYVPFWGDKEDRTGVPYGIIRDLMYLQDEVNARISKMQWGLSAVRTERTENAVAMSDEVFRQSIGRPDADIILNKKEMVSGGVFKVERDFDLNTQQYNRLLDLRESITRVSGVSEAFSGAGGSDTFSALSAQIEQTVQSLARINDNFRYSRQMVGDLLLLMLIEDCQEQEEVVVSGGLIKDDRLVVLNAPTVDQQSGVQYLDNDVARTKTKVTISDVPSTPSFRQQQLSSLSEAFKSAPPQFQSVMMPHLMNLMDVPNKKEIVEAIRNVAQMPTEDEIEQRIKDEVARALAESDRDLKERELDIKDRLTTAQIEKLVNEAVNKAIDSIYSATQAGREIAATPQVAGIADQILGSAGFIDNDRLPVVAPPAVQAGAAPQPVRNTSPMFPPRVQDQDVKQNSVNEMRPDSPAVGMQRGIEAPENAAVGDITAGA